ncbi:hypothetical protein P2318_22895 [Myxococcaceae bacterium GXIMD 01537]
MKHFRMKLGAAALIATASLVGCSDRDGEGQNNNNDDAGCTGVCSSNDAGTDGGTKPGTDAGTDGGTTNPGTDGGTTNPGTDGGTTNPGDDGGTTNPGDDGGTTNPGDDGGTTEPDGGTGDNCPAPVDGKGPVGQVRANSGQGQAVDLQGLVVTEVEYLSKPGSQGDYVSQFWVAHPCFPTEGIYVDKYFTDGAKGYGPVVGDIVHLKGLFRNYNSKASDNAPDDRTAYRAVIKSAFRLEGATGILEVTKTGTMTPPADNTTPDGFGNAQSGVAMANPEYAGSRVFIPGPLTVTNANPAAFKARPDDPSHTQFYGFEVSGGILVNNYKTFGETRDGGSTRCDWRAITNDGGTVTFPDGIRGVWDSYSYVPCNDGGYTLPDGGTSSSCNFNLRGDGLVPGTGQPFTYVLYPQNCETDLKGSVTVTPP